MMQFKLPNQKKWFAGTCARDLNCRDRGQDRDLSSRDRDETEGRLPTCPRRDRDETFDRFRDRLETETSRPRPHPWKVNYFSWSPCREPWPSVDGQLTRKTDWNTIWRQRPLLSKQHPLLLHSALDIPAQPHSIRLEVSTAQLGSAMKITSHHACSQPANVIHCLMHASYETVAICEVVNNCSMFIRWKLFPYSRYFKKFYDII